MAIITTTLRWGPEKRLWPIDRIWASILSYLKQKAHSTWTNKKSRSLTQGKKYRNPLMRICMSWRRTRPIFSTPCSSTTRTPKTSKKWSDKASTDPKRNSALPTSMSRKAASGKTDPSLPSPPKKSILPWYPRSPKSRPGRSNLWADTSTWSIRADWAKLTTWPSDRRICPSGSTRSAGPAFARRGFDARRLRSFLSKSKDSSWRRGSCSGDGKRGMLPFAKTRAWYLLAQKTASHHWP